MMVRSNYILSFLSIVCVALARPTEVLEKRQGFNLKNGQDAIALNNKFRGLNANSPCQTGENACIQNGFAQCVNGKFVIQGCAPGTVCAALPLVNAPGTSIACTTAADRDARIAATGAQGGGSGVPPANNGPQRPQPNAPKGNNGGGNQGGNNNNGGGNQNNNNNGGGNNGNGGGNGNGGNGNGGNGGNNNNNNGGDPQRSLTLDPAVIAKGFANDGQGQPSPGQVPSLTSTNNFINFCKTVNLPITNGAQIADGSCNPAPMGAIPSKFKMPASKFVFPQNLGNIAPNQGFTVKMAIKNLETGHFVNAAQNYFSAPQQLNRNGFIQGHSHVVIQRLQSMKQTSPVEPTEFAFFKGLNGAANNGILEAEVSDGLPAGVYRISSINTASNHQPVLVPVAQHGSLDDAVYFTVG